MSDKKTPSSRLVNFLLSESEKLRKNVHPDKRCRDEHFSDKRNEEIGVLLADTLYLDLKKRDNNLVIVIAEYFGGCGFQAKLNNDK